MLKFIYFMKDYKKESILGPIFKLIEAILELFVPIVMAKIIDVGINNKDINYVFKMGIVLVSLGAVGLLFALVCQYYASIASQGAGTSIRSKLYKHINELSHAEIDKIGTPTLITRIVNDINQIQTGIAMLIRLGTRSPFIIIGSIIMAFSIDLKLSIIFLVTTPLITLVIYFVMKKSLPLYKVIQEKLDNLSLITRENLEGARVIKAFSKENHEKERFSEAANNLSTNSLDVGKISAMLNPITYIIMNMAIMTILWFGGINVNIGSLTQGEVIAFVNYITQILLSLIVFSQLIITLTKGATSANRVLEILNIKTSISDTAVPSNKAKKVTDNAVPSNNIKEVNDSLIEFKNVSFSYEESNECSLKDINLNINKNEIIGIIGGTGSGKTTLINLIPRFYDATVGEVLINGVNVKDYNINKLRNLVGMVPQKAVLFKGSILDNLKWGNEDATIDEIEEALEISNSKSFVDSLPEKYNSKVLQGGKNFSGGQKQRLTIARALVKKPEILILDDSSSALDFATDAALRKALKEKTKDMTVLIVSQRASSIMNADKIIVLDNGEITGIGNHDYLLKNCEVYNEIYSSQLNN